MNAPQIVAWYLSKKGSKKRGGAIRQQLRGQETGTHNLTL